MKIWGYWATLGWSILAFLAGQFVGFGVLLWLRRGDWDSLLLTSFDGVVVTIFCDSAAKYLSESFWQEMDSEAENWP